MRRAQIEFGETLMVVIVLVFILIIGIVFYYSTSKRSLANELAYREDIESIKLAKAVAALPETSYTERATASPSVTDALKLGQLAKMLDRTNSVPIFDATSRAYYEDLFGYAQIQVHTLATPTQSAPPVIVFYANKPSGKLTTSAQSLFTVLFDPVTKTHKLTYLNITRYTVEASQ